MDVRWRVRGRASSVRARSTVIAGAKQLFGAALVLVRCLSSQALSRIFPLGRSGEVIQIVNLSFGCPGLFPSLRQRSQLVDGAGHVVAALLGVLLLLLLLLSRADGIRLLQRGWRAVRAGVHRDRAARTWLSRGRSAERRVTRVFATV